MLQAKTNNPYPGTRAFQDQPEDRRLFFGREQESKDLLSLVLSEQHVLLFARSGVGKTSLINAHLLESLRARNFFPVTARLTFSLDQGPIRSIIDRVVEEATTQKIYIKGSRNSGSLWNFFRRAGFEKNGKPLRPVLILDQFEELFTRFEGDKREIFIAQLSDLAAGRVPPTIRAAALRMLDRDSLNNQRRSTLTDIVYGNAALDIKILMSIREDFLAEMHAFKSAMPSIFRNTLRIGPLTRAQAEEAIVKPLQQQPLDGSIHFAPDAVKAVLDFLSTQKTPGAALPSSDIEPIQLQILCHGLFERAQQAGRHTISVADLGGQRGLQRLIKQHYRDVLKQFPTIRIGWNARQWRPDWANLVLFNLPRRAIQRLCENGLILVTGQRNNLAESYIARQYGIPSNHLVELVRQRLLRTITRLGGTFYELTHDSLIGVLLSARAHRRLLLGSTLAAAIFLAWFVVPSASNYASAYITEIRSRPLIKTIQDAQLQFPNRFEAFTQLVRLSPNINLSKLELRDFSFDQNVFSSRALPTIPSPGLQQFFVTALSFRESELLGVTFKSTRFLGTRVSFEDGKISQSNFENATLENVTFRRAILEDVSFKNAILFNATYANARKLARIDFSRADLFAVSFAGANLMDTTFLEANLPGANFSQTTLTNVNFAGARLNQTNFSGANWSNVNFSQSTWWLAFGWTDDQLSKLKNQFPVSAYTRSKAYMQGRDKRRLDVEAAKKTNDVPALSGALNELAWYQAIHGTELPEALISVREALSIRRPTPNILDTEAYILMQQKRYEEAESRLKQALGVNDQDLRQSDNTMSVSVNPSIIYRYALTLDYLGKSDEAKKFYELSSRYRPTHERVLVPVPSTVLQAK